MQSRSGQLKDFSTVDLLSHLTSEFHRYERDRKKWEIDSNKLQLKIKHLEDERKLQYEINKDLVRRVKLLEFALRTERAKRPTADQASDSLSAENGDLMFSSQQYLKQYTETMAGIELRASTEIEELICSFESPSTATDKPAEKAERPEKTTATTAPNTPKASQNTSTPSRSPRSEPKQSTPTATDVSSSATGSQSSADSRSVDAAKPSKQADRPSPSRPAEPSKEPTREIIASLAPEAKSVDVPKSEAAPEAPKSVPSSRDKTPKESAGTQPQIPPVVSSSSQPPSAPSKDSTMDFYTQMQSSESRSENPREWILKSTLKSHMDGVRDVVFHPQENTLFSASEDQTIKYWAIKQNVPTPRKSAGSSDIEPVYTFRGHSGPVYSIAVNHKADVFYSGGGDGFLRKWKIPLASDEPYRPTGKASFNQVKSYTGHLDAIWDLIAVPNENRVISASADGTVRLWNMDKETPLSSTFMYPSESDEAYIPTSIGLMNDNFSQVAVGYSCNSIGVVDLERCQPVFEVSIEEGKTTKGPTTGRAARKDSQVNKIVVHPTFPLIISAHEDHHIRYFDARSGEMVHSMIGHSDAVTDLDIDSHGLNLVSCGHDSSIRFWDIMNRECLNEVSAHRNKYNESVHCVAFHASGTYTASGGADASIKIFQ